MASDNRGVEFERRIDSFMESSGHRRIKRQVYKLKFDTDPVEHFFYLSKGRGVNGLVFGGGFGIREPTSDKFSIYCLRKFGILAARTAPYNEKCDCLFKVAITTILIGKVKDLNEIDKNCFYPEQNFDSELEKFEAKFQKCCDIIIGATENLNDYYGVLISHDPEKWFTWRQQNPVTRCSQAVAVGKLIGIDDEIISKQLSPNYDRINARASNTLTIDPDTYIERVFEEWNSFDREKKYRVFH